MQKGKKRPQEFFFGERVYNVVKGANGKGDIYGISYVSKELIGKKIVPRILTEKDLESIEVVKREYSHKRKRKKKNI